MGDGGGGGKGTRQPQEVLELDLSRKQGDPNANNCLDQFFVFVFLIKGSRAVLF